MAKLDVCLPNALSVSAEPTFGAGSLRQGPNFSPHHGHLGSRKNPHAQATIGAVKSDALEVEPTQASEFFCFSCDSKFENPSFRAVLSKAIATSQMWLP